MDFRRPGEHPTEDHNHHIDGTDGYMPPAQAPASFPQPKRSKGHVLLTTVMSILVFGLAAYGVYAYLTEQQLRQRESDLTSRVNTLETQLQSANRTKNDKTDAAPVSSELTTKEKIELASSTYACLIKGFGCDKNTTTVVKTQEPAGIEPGYANVKVTSASGAAINLILRTSSVGDWIVIYEGATPPSAEIVQRYAIPSTVL